MEDLICLLATVHTLNILVLLHFMAIYWQILTATSADSLFCKSRQFTGTFNSKSPALCALKLTNLILKVEVFIVLNVIDCRFRWWVVLKFVMTFLNWFDPDSYRKHQCRVNLEYEVTRLFSYVFYSSTMYTLGMIYCITFVVNLSVTCDCIAWVYHMLLFLLMNAKFLVQICTKLLHLSGLFYDQGSSISLIWGEKRCVSDMFDINVFVLYVSGIVCFQSFVASNIVNYFYDRTKAIFFGENVLMMEYYIGCHSVGENMECFDSCRQ